MIVNNKRLRTVRRPNNKYGLGSLLKGAFTSNEDDLSKSDKNLLSGINAIGNSFASGLQEIAQQNAQNLQAERQRQATQWQAQENLTNSIHNQINDTYQANLARQQQFAQQQQAALQQNNLNAYGGHLNKFMLGSLISTGLAVDKGVGSVIGGNMHSGAGDTLSKIPGMGVVGGVVNRLFGSNVNQDAVDSKNAQISNVANQSINGSDSSSLLNSWNNRSTVSAFSKKDIGSDGLFNHKASKTYKQLVANAAAATVQQNANGALAANNLNSRNTEDAMYNISAQGGPLEVALMNDYIVNDRLKSGIGNRIYSMPSNFGMGESQFAFGGDVMTNGADYSTGMKHINAGETHEENPYEGVPIGADPQGNPNLVEEGETIYDDYVFSNRLIVPEQKAEKGKKLTQEQKILKKYSNITYANAAKKAEHECGVDERPNDPIAKQGFEAVLTILASSQEKERAIAELEEQQGDIEAQKKQLENMSAEQYTALQAQQAMEQQQQQQMAQQQAQAQQQSQQQAIQQEAIQQQGQYSQQQPQETQPTPEEAMAMQQQMAAYGGQLFAEGGQLSPEELAAAQAQEQQAQQANYQQAQEQAMADQRQLQDQSTEQPQTEEAPKQELTGIDNGTPADEMSTSELNETIDQIYQWAKANGVNDLAKRARKIKRASRESKEDFVDDALEDISIYESQKASEQEQQAVQEGNNPDEQTAQAQQAQLMQEQQAQEAAQEASAANELNAQMQDTQQYAQGGQMSQQEQLQILDAFMEQLGQSQDENILQYYNQFTKLKQANDQQSLAQAYQLASQLYQAYTQQANGQQSYAFGGAMNLNSNLQTYSGLPQATLKRNGTQENLKRLLKSLGYNIEEGTEITNDDILKAFEQADSKTINIKKAKRAINKAYKEKGIDPSKLKGRALDKYNQDLMNQAIALKMNEFEVPNSYSQNLFINNSAIGNNKAKALANYNNQALIDELIGTGNYIVEPNDKGEIPWGDNIANRYSIIEEFPMGENGASISTNDPSYWNTDENDLSANTRGIYGYNKNELQGLDKWDLKQFADDINNEVALKDKKFVLSKSGQLPYSTGLSEEDATNLIDNDTKEFWEYLKSNPNEWDSKKLEDIKKALVAKGNNNKIKANELTLDQAYNWAMTGKWGNYHTPVKPVQEPLAYRFVTPLGKYLALNDPNDYQRLVNQYGKDAKEENINGITYRTITIPDETLERNLLKIGDTTLNISNNPEILKSLKTSKEPLGKDAQLGTGYNGITHWFTYDWDNDADNTPDKNDDVYPIPAEWPYYLGAGIQLGATVGNILNKPDYSGVNAIINASKEAGKYTPVNFKPVGEYVKYNPYDINYVNNQANANNQAAIRQLQNASNGNTGALMAGLMSQNYNYGLGIGKNYRESFEYNDANRLKSAEFNRGTDEFNSEGALKAAMANQDAQVKARASQLDGLYKGYGLRHEIEKDRSNAISANLSGLANMLFNAYAQNVYNKQAAWRLNHTDQLGTQNVTTNHEAKGGKIRRKKHKGLSF